MSTRTPPAPAPAPALPPYTPAPRRRGAAPGARREAAKRRLNNGATVTPLKVISEIEGVPYSSARDAANAGEFPVAKIGAVNFVKPPEFRRWLNNKFTIRRG